MSIITILLASAAALLLAALGLYAFSRWLQKREPYRSFMQLRLAQKVSFFRHLYADPRVPWYVKLVPIAMGIGALIWLYAWRALPESGSAGKP